MVSFIHSFVLVKESPFTTTLYMNPVTTFDLLTENNSIKAILLKTPAKYYMY